MNHFCTGPNTKTRLFLAYLRGQRQTFLSDMNADSTEI